MDTCFRSGKDSQKNTRGVSINEGLIKKVNNEFYYAATDKSSNLKLFATELVSLGSIFECDWQGIPKIQKQLIPSTFKVPPDTQELTDDKKQIETSGMVDIGGNTCGNFFSIDCLGLHVDSRQCINVRHICEMGVDIDQAELSPTDNNTILNQADCIISSIDIDDNFGKWTRDVFYGLNKSTTPWTGVNKLTIPSGGYSTEFNTAINPTVGDYNQTAIGPNGADYVNFRNININNTPVSDNNFGQSDHSYYFYFGLEPGNTGLDKMNKKFFSSCIKPQKDGILIESNSTPDIFNMGTGCTTFSFIGGTGPFKYIITGLNTPQGNPLNITPIEGTVLTSNVSTQPICGLYPGTYLISATDALGTPVSDTVSVNGAIPLYSYSFVSKIPSKDTTNDGKITIGNAGGGRGQLRYTLKNSQGVTVSGPDFATTNLVIGGLGSDTIGYTLTIYDESVPPLESITTGLTMTGPSVMNITYTGTNIHCSGGNNGKIKLKVNGGVSPYMVNTVGLNYSSPGLDLGGLGPGDYTVTVVDSVGSAATQTIKIIEENPLLTISKPENSNDISTQCDPDNYKIPFDITTGVSSGNVNIEYSLDAGDVWIPTLLPYKSDNRYMISVPKSSVGSDGVLVRYWVDYYPQPNVPVCYSEELVYEVSEMELPPMIMGIKDGLGSNYSTALEAIYHNKKQCNPNFGTYTFSINQLDTGFTGRAPYTIEYKVDNPLSTTITKTHYNGLVSLSGNRNTNFLLGVVDNKIDFYVKISDNKGCIFPANATDNANTWYKATLILPQTEMTKTIVTTGPNSLGKYTHKLSVQGGVSPLNLSGVGVINPSQTYTFTTNSLVYVSTVTDANGCTLQIIG
jgi:hypothetical protein